MIRLARVAVYSAAIAAQATAVPKVYRNREFRIELQVPKDVKLCVGPNGEHEHGFVLQLGGGPAKGCFEDKYRRSVSVFAFGNALDDTKQLSGLLNMGCEISGGQCQKGPAALEIPGLASATGRVNRPDGWVDLIVVTQAGEPSAYEPNEPSVNYIFSLRTRPEHLDEDLKVFRTVLQTVKLPSARVKRR